MTEPKPYPTPERFLVLADYYYRKAHPTCPRSVPWAMLAPHEAWAEKNHGQTLARINQRGGLSPLEMVAVLENRRFRDIRHMTGTEALDRLTFHIDVWEQSE